MSELGIYFGPKQIEVAEVKSRKLVNNVSLTVAEVSGNELDEKVPAEIKITAAFNDAFRRNKIDSKEAVLCLSGKDLIIRTFEIPTLPKEELQGAINFEAKKYMPFKTEDLISGYQIEVDKSTRTNMVLYMGIKKETFAKYSSVFNQLNIRLRSIEYAGFSVLKLLKLSGVKGSGVVGVICADSQGKDEINFTVLENGFPLFTRDISLSGAADDLEKGEGAEAEGSLDKLKSEFRVSMDYYRRKFPTKNIKNMVIICGQDWRLDIETYLSELGLPNKFIDIAKVIGRSVIYSSSLAKSYSAAIFKAVNTRVSLDLIGSKAKAEKVSSGQIEALSLLKGLKIDVRFILLGVFMCAGVFAYGIIKRNPFEQELSVTLRERIQVSGVPADSGLESLELLTYKYNNTLKNLEDLIKNQLYVTETVNIVPRVLPQGLWLTRFFFSSNTEGGYELTIEGLSYLGDNDKEFQAVNSFLKSLNASSIFTKYFKNISIVSIDRKEFAREQVTQFVILCKTAVKAGR